MAKVREILSKPVVTVLLFVLAAGLLLTSTIGGTRAVLNYYSEDYLTEVELDSIGVSLMENGVVVEGSDALLTELLAPGEELQTGRAYDEELSVLNDGSIDQFVRVSVYKYWEDAEGKRPDMDADWIELGFVTDGSWVIDEDASTTERTVLYRTAPLAPGESSDLFLDTIGVSNEVINKVTQTTTTEGDLTRVTTTYDYDGTYIRLVAHVDAVQTHNGQDAVKSAWGRDVTISGDRLILN